MGKKGRKFINRNDPSTLTFNLVSASYDDPRLRPQSCKGDDGHDSDDDLGHTPAARERSVLNALRRSIPKNAAKKGNFIERVSDDLLKVLEPCHFGIHSNLSDDHLRLLCHEIYGVDEISEELRNKIDYSLTTSGKNSLTEEALETADCYFPLDGYDYEKHLRPIQPGGHFIPAKKTDLDKKEGIELTIKVKNFTLEEKDLFEAIENPDGYESLSDDFVLIAEGEALTDGLITGSHTTELDLLWGGVVSQLPHRLDSNEQREIDTLLKATRNLDLVANSDNNEEDDQRYLFVNKNRVTEQDLDSVLAREYAEDQIGELDENDEKMLKKARYHIDYFDYLLDEFAIDKKKQFTHVDSEAQSLDDVEGIDPLSKEERGKILELAEKHLDDGKSNWQDEGNELMVVEESHRERQQWDCETILSTRSNLWNHPGRIDESSLLLLGVRVAECSKKLGTSPLNAILHARNLKSVRRAANINKLGEGIQRPLEQANEKSESDSDTNEDEEFCSVPCVITKRPKDESRDEKKARKAAAKEARRMIRQCKKENSAVIKEASIKQLQVTNSKNPFDIRDGIRRFRL